MKRLYGVHVDVSSEVQRCIYLSLIDIKVWLLVFQAQLCTKVSSCQGSKSTLVTSDGKTHLSLTSGDRRNIPGRVNEMLAQRVLLLCFSALQRPDSALSLQQLSCVQTSSSQHSHHNINGEMAPLIYSDVQLSIPRSVCFAPVRLR
jgi:hypothetical protein